MRVTSRFSKKSRGTSLGSRLSAVRISPLACPLRNAYRADKRSVQPSRLAKRGENGGRDVQPPLSRASGKKSPLDNSRREKPHQGAGGKQLIPVFYDPSHATALLEHIHAKPRLRGQPRARNVYPPSLETGDLGHHICIHKSTSSTIERHSQNHMESMKLSHPLSSLAPYAAGQEQERKEKTAAPLMHPSQRKAGE